MAQTVAFVQSARADTLGDRLESWLQRAVLVALIGVVGAKPPAKRVLQFFTLSPSMINTDVLSSGTSTSSVHFNPLTSCSRSPVLTLKSDVRAR